MFSYVYFKCFISKGRIRKRKKRRKELGKHQTKKKHVKVHKDTKAQRSCDWPDDLYTRQLLTVGYSLSPPDIHVSILRSLETIDRICSACSIHQLPSSWSPFCLYLSWTWIRQRHNQNETVSRVGILPKSPIFISLIHFIYFRQTSSQSSSEECKVSFFSLSLYRKFLRQWIILS